MAWSEWQNISKYGKCIYIGASYKTSSGSNNYLLDDNPTVIDSEYLSIGTDSSIIIKKPCKVKLYLITKTASNAPSNTHGTIKKNGNVILTTNDGKTANHKSAFSEVSFEAGDTLVGTQYANGTATTQTVLMFI